MLNGWKVPFDIAQRRDQTKRGRDHMTPHAEEVISHLYNFDLMMLTTALMLGRPIEPDQF